MRIKLSPQRRDDTLSISKVGNALVINSEVYDFSVMKNGDRLPASAVKCEYIVGEISFNNDELEIEIILPLPENYTYEQAYPKDIYFNGDGKIPLPEKPVEDVR